MLHWTGQQSLSEIWALVADGPNDQLVDMLVVEVTWNISSQSIMGINEPVPFEL